MNLVEVYNRTRAQIDLEVVEQLALGVLAAEGVEGAELAVEFVGERCIRRLNGEYRGKDYVTDVLSFPLEGEEGGAAEGPHAPPRLLGDVVICTRQALRQARTDASSPVRELAMLVVHGTLHLLGYDHEVDGGEMLARQEELLAHLSWEGLLKDE